MCLFDHSAYSTICGKEPPFTTATPPFTATIDYIFCGGGAEPISCLGLPDPPDSCFGGIPNSHHPSDHLPLLVTLGLQRYSTSSAEDVL